MDKKKAAAAAAGAVAGAAAGRLVDLALMGGLIATAAGAVGFAGYETMFSDHMPHINGLQYLAIFAQPSHHPPALAQNGKGAIDMAPTGALSHPAPQEAAGYALVGAQGRFAWLREGNRIFAVYPGDDVARLGHVVSIETREGRWTLVGRNGETLLAGAPVDLGEGAVGRFDKKMTFKGAP